MSKIEFSIYKDFEVQGKWWVLGNEDLKLSGILKNSKEGLILDIFGSFGSASDLMQKNESKVHDIIVGNTFEGEVTLVECTEIYATASHFYDIDDSETYTRYIVRRAVKGRHYESKSHILLPKLTVEFTNLQAWLGYQPFESTHKPLGIQCNTDIETFESYVESERLKISSNISFSYTNAPFKSEILYKPAIVFEPDEPQNIEWYEEKIRSFQRLLCVLTNSKVFVESMRYLTFSKERSITIVTSQAADYTNKELSIGNVFLIGFQELGHSISTVIQKWYSCQIESSLLLYINVILRGSNMNIEDKFLSYAKAMESGHRNSSVSENKFMDDEDYKKIVQRMIDSVKHELDVNFINKLQGTLRYAHEYGFQRRIKETIKSVSEDLRVHLLLGNSVQNFADLIRINRDYYTHFGDSSDKIFTTSQLYYVNKSLKLIVLWQISREIEIPEEVLVKAIEREAYDLLYLQKGVSLFRITDPIT
ncbi:ApeA N-terminal domain 1-containing protein [Paenibacillus sp. FSL P4-0288]|uniref:ApeA N-terminal domain 1-containing protein n=1 Tax=Paenibacillus sp. FSL P4-0288 TaxID=2921633 RepID=UPI0030F7E6DD